MVSSRMQRVLCAVSATAILAALALSTSSRPAQACSGAYCTDPEQPVEVQASAIDSSTVRVSWVGHQSTQYDTVDVSVRRDSPTGLETISRLPIHGGQGSYQGHYPWYVTVTNLSFNTTYCFAVRTRGDNQTVSAWSDYACTTTPYPPFSTTTPPPPAPATFHLDATASGGSVTLTWTYQSSDGAPDYFGIRRDGTQVDTAISHGNGTYQYTDAGPLTAGHVYSYQVCAMYGSGDIRLVGDCSNVPTVIAPLPGSLVPALLSISQPTVTAGNTVVVSGQAFPATGGTVQITLQRDPAVVSLGSATISGGSFATTVTIPADTSPGSYTIRAEAMGAQADTTIQVIAPSSNGTLTVTAAGLVFTTIDLDNPFTLSGTNFTPGPATIFIDSPNGPQIGTATVGTDGTFQKDLVVSSDLGDSVRGQHNLVAVQNGTVEGELAVTFVLPEVIR